MLDLDAIFVDAPDANEPPIKGKWFEIRLQPDLAADERLNIGVCFLDNRRKLHFKLLEETSAFSCLYGRQAKEQFDFMIRAVRHSLEQSSWKPPSPQITFGPPRFAAGFSIQEILDSLYADIVTLARVKRKMRNEFASKDNEEIRHIVFEAMRDIDTLLANTLISGGEIPLSIETDEGPHEVFLPIRKDARFGTIVSAVYKKHDQIDSNLKGAALDLSVALKAYPQNQAGLFVLRASDGILRHGDAALLQIDNVIDMTEWRAKKLGIRLTVEDTPNRLAQDILEWGFNHRVN